MMNYIYTLIPIALLIFAAVQGSKWNFNAATYMDKKYTNGLHIGWTSMVLKDIK